MSTAATQQPGAPSTPSLFRRAMKQKRFTFGFTVTLLVIAFVIVAPFLAPYGEKETAGRPYAKDGLFGTDYLGQDVLSRVMHGGEGVLVISVLATLLGMVLGVLLGVVAAYAGGWWDEVLMRLNDVLLAFPQILLALVVLTALRNPAWWVIVLLIGISHAPRVARLARGVALGIVSRDFVVAAEALGEKRSRVIAAEVLPNMTGPLLAEAGLRLTYSIGVVASLGFLGFAADPGAANWGQMMNENRLGLATQPWAVVAPVLMIAIFTIATNLMADGLAQVSQTGDN
jgi:peptide/nickel transport system permease protein